MSSILILLFLIFYLILAYLRLDLAILAMAVLLPSYLVRFSVLGIPMTLLEGMILISFAVWFIRNYKQIFDNIKNKIRLLKDSRFDIQHSKLKRYPFDVEIILLLVISYLTVATTGFSNSALGIWKAYFFEPALVFILIFNLFIANRRKLSSRCPELNFGLEKILFALAVSALGVSLLAIYQKFTGAWILNESWANPETRRVTSFFGYPNAVGLYLGPLILIFTGWLYQQIANYKSPAYAKASAGRQITNKFQIPKTIFILSAVGLSMLAVYFAKSKGALLGIAAGLITFAFLVNKKSRWAMIIILLILGIGILGYAPAKNKIYNKFIYSKSWQIRKAGWEETWAMLKDGRIFSGAGLANYQQAVRPYHQEGIFYNDGSDPDFHRHTVFNADYRARVWQPLEIYLYPHNIFLNFWSELGLAGMLLFIWIFIKFFSIGIKKIRNSDEQKEKYLIIGLVCSMIVILIHGQVDVPYFKNDLSVMFWILLAMVGALNLEAEKLK